MRVHWIYSCVIPTDQYAFDALCPIPKQQHQQNRSSTANTDDNLPTTLRLIWIPKMGPGTGYVGISTKTAFGTDVQYNDF